MFNAHSTGRSSAALARNIAAFRTLSARLRKQNSHSGTQDPAGEPDWLRHVPAEFRDLVKTHLPEGWPNFNDGIELPHFKPRVGRAAMGGSRPGVSVPKGAQFLSKSFGNAAGRRDYKLFVPSGYAGQPVQLVVMLHGCTQSPDDFAAGTGMNKAAEAQNFLVAYPRQSQGDQAQKCWKWFSPGDQKRDRGEPSIIAGITREVMREFSIDPLRVYVAGLSAGGAAASVMGAAYPDLYAAIGVHSGLACGAAYDLPSAFTAMKRGGRGITPSTTGGAANRALPSIVFHGDRDTTVSPLNANHVAEQTTKDIDISIKVETGQVPGGHRYTRAVSLDQMGQALTEQWVIHGAGHAWSGGSLAGSYTDPLGPNATMEMLRFFGQHPRSRNG